LPVSRTVWIHPPTVRFEPPANRTHAVSFGGGQSTTRGTLSTAYGADVPAAPSDVFGAGSLTDVAELLVGHHQRLGRGWQTGTTVVLAPEGAVAAVDVRGGGPGTRETDALDSRNLVDRIHAVCLSGGSAYGLAAADGVVAHLERRRLGVPVGPEPEHVVPVVPAAVIFDLGRGGRFANRPTAEFGARAATAARRRGVARGTVGAGSGARAGGMQGGVGMASTSVCTDNGTLTVAALAVVNASGSVIDPATALPWCPLPGLRRPSADDRRRWAIAVEPAAHEQKQQPLNTTIGVVATDADLVRTEVGRLAQSAHDGLARAVRPAHLLVDGDAIFGLATGVHGMPVASRGLLREAGSRTTLLNRLFAAAAEVFAMACTDAVANARTVGDALAYRDLCPTAFRKVGL
jgi:L-aminopeptidase/D-esterase-like protein